MTCMRYDYDQLYKDLTSVKPRTKLFITVKRAMVKRGNYKALPRGSYKKYGAEFWRNQQ